MTNNYNNNKEVNTNINTNKDVDDIDDDDNDYKIIKLVPDISLEEIVIKLFKMIDIQINEIGDLNNMIVRRDIFLNNSLYPKLIVLIPKIKDFLKSSYLTSLQSNSEIKQKFPCLNLFRQILKCYHYKMTPFIVAQGYNKVTGKKIITRFFKIEALDN